MPLPQNFSEFEFLQDLVRKWQNRIVREEFNDLGGDEFDPDINISRHAIRHGCTIKDNDTAEMTIIRLYLYYFIHRKAQDLQRPVYGIPVTSFQESLEFYPQVMLYFVEDQSDVDEEYSPIDGQIQFRLINFHPDTNPITEAEIEACARKVREKFATNNGFLWRKGKTYYGYCDKKKGYKLQLLCRDESEAKRIVEQVLDIQNHTPEWRKLKLNSSVAPTEAYPTIPETKQIAGKRVRLPRSRPVGTVRFQYATLDVWGLRNPIVLVDRTRLFRNALLTA